MVNYDLNRITPQVIFEAARACDSIAKEIYEQAGFYIGVAVSNIISAVGLQRVVIGGGVSQAGDLLLDPIRRSVAERVNVTSIEKVQIVRAELGPNAGLIGARVWVSID